MTSINKTVLIGHVGATPEVRYTPSGDAVINLSVATTNRYLDKKTEEWKETTDWHRVVIFGKLAAKLGSVLAKGSEVFIEGSLRTRKWQDASGQDRYQTEIVANICKLFSKEPASTPPAPLYKPQDYSIPDDLPF